jgi:hypothetical protein
VLGTPDRWVISVAWVLPWLWPVNIQDFIIRDWATWTLISVSMMNMYINAWITNVAVWGLGANQGPFNATIQAMLDRILYPFTAMTASLGSWYIFEKWAEQAPLTLTASFVNSLNPRYPVTSVVFKRWVTTIDTKLWADLATPQTFVEAPTIIDTVTFSAVVSDSKPESATPTRTLTAIYPWFYGKVAGWVKPTKDQALINSGTKVVGTSTGTITATFASGPADRIRFAIPQTSTSKTAWYIDAINNWAIGWGGNLFDSESIVSIDSPTVLWNGVNYKIYVSNYQSEVVSPMQLQN